MPSFLERVEAAKELKPAGNPRLQCSLCRLLVKLREEDNDYCEDLLATLEEARRQMREVTVGERTVTFGIIREVLAEDGHVVAKDALSTHFLRSHRWEQSK